MGKTAIWWIRRDIRLSDNPALTAAAENADQLIPLFILEPQLMENAAPKRRSFLLNALADLDQQLNKLGSRLVVRQGPAQAAMQAIKETLPEVSVYAHKDFSPFARQRDAQIKSVLPFKSFSGLTIRDPNEILKGDGDPYVVYTPYKNKWYSEPIPTPGDILPIPEKLPPLPDSIESITLPNSPQVTGFPASEQEAQTRLDEFLSDALRYYKSQRDRMDLDGTSSLSPYFRFGLLSAREAFTQAQIVWLQSKNSQERAEIRTWMDELVWREFYTAILYHFPKVMGGPFREDYQNIPWRESTEDLHAWQEGQTGYPIVDACMRQLKETGWMHNRGRMIAASFLTKDLLINWQLGEDWFMNNLVDGDPAANNGGWQWSAGTGTDAAPYFRIFNPVLQGKKFDPEGAYIAQWVPELSQLPVEFRHEPWLLSNADAHEYGFRLGETYPQRIVDHDFARQRTLDAYQFARNL